MEKITESNIVGQFRGWKSGRGYKLENGEIWKQVEYKYKYNYDIVSRPRAIIWKEASKFFLEVEGMVERVEVQRGTRADLEEDY